MDDRHRKLAWGAFQMPIRCCSLVPAIATRFSLFRPRSVLDLRIGMGFYGAVVRQWLKGCGGTRLFGVDSRFVAYRGPCWDLKNKVMDWLRTAWRRHRWSTRQTDTSRRDWGSGRHSQPRAFQRAILPMAPLVFGRQLRPSTQSLPHSDSEKKRTQ
jgi:hypothetical protein